MFISCSKNYYKVSDFYSSFEVLRCQTKIAVQTDSDENYLCSDRPRRQQFVRSKDFHAFISADFVRVQQTLCAHVQTFVRSCSNLRALFDIFGHVNFERTRAVMRSTSVWTYLIPSGTSACDEN